MPFAFFVVKFSFGVRANFLLTGTLEILMADIVVCGDLEHEIEKTGELTKLQTLGSVEIINELDPTRQFLIRRLHGARAVLEIRGRAALDEKTSSSIT